MKTIAYFFFFISLNQYSCAQEADTSLAAMPEYVQEAMQDRYIVLAAAGSDYGALDQLAKEISMKTGIPYENEMIFDPEEGLILPRDTARYDIDAGQYMPRRSEENAVSIEMLRAYADSFEAADQLKMVIVTGIFENKEEAQKQLQLVKLAVPQAYIKKRKLYMGCTH